METIIRLQKSEGFLRVISVVLAIATALVMGLVRETKKVIIVEKEATVHDLQAIWVATIIASAAAGYHVLQLCRWIIFTWDDRNPRKMCNKLFPWACFILDQGATYAMFSGTTAAIQGSVIALFGVEALQWDELCNIYTRFCVGIGVGLIFGILASLAMAIVSSVSAYRLVHFYCSDSRSVSRVAEQSFF